ncbi:uncharacterized protein PFL1_01865 [Pseudozyma flocculosa PF-1]|uniref:Translocon-associated protein subunit alpha n=1 Tax=Pseudozyma flocculosa TaxID=84751 RepID=A0A5C3EYX1_9BASI|nr:uncharacterized protein PFL1_01865 [Pseudozyma flocculosa PF-1]EPQ30339.1 hypothetical protein PFL1_01865 [Pseudozyma flocculosa PF-1]SPO37408.1 uncharacterized protein PSFLO_02881 [Pseudozyma flocculosa]
MRFSSFLATALLALAPAALVAAQANDTPELGIVTTFPNNPFSIVKNGQPNTVVFSITNPPKEDRLLTLQSVTGAFLNLKKTDGQKGRVVRNMTTTAFKSRPLRSVGGKPVQIPFDFVPEFKPQEMGVEFSLLVNDEQTGKKHRIEAYRGKVQVIEPPKNWFDWQLLSVYALGLAFVAGAALFAYNTYLAPQTSKKAAPKKPVAAAAGQEKKVDRPTLVKTKSGAYEEDWIPEAHIRARKTRSAGGALSSGDDEPVSPGRKQRKGRK